MVTKRVPVFFDPDRKLIVDMDRTRHRCRRRDHCLNAKLTEQFKIPKGIISSSERPVIQVTQLNAQNRCLQSVQAAIHSQRFGIVFRSRAVDAQQTQFVCEPGITCSDHATVTGGSQIL